MSTERQRWSWSRDRTEARLFQEEANRLVGQQLIGVRYVDIDYFADEYRGEVAGPRDVESSREWRQPTWTCPTCDSVAFTVELLTESGRRFTVSWESPGGREGLGMREFGAIGSAVRPDADVAIWDVSHRSRWRTYLHAPIDSVDLRFEAWDGSEAQWCPRIDLSVAGRTIVMLLADCDPQSNDLMLSADNVAIVFDQQVPTSKDDGTGQSQEKTLGSEPSRWTDRSAEDTHELLSDPEAMRQLRDSRQAYTAGDFVTGDKLRTRYLQE